MAPDDSSATKRLERIQNDLYTGSAIRERSGMDRIVIRGGTPLKGSIRVAGAKNAALPLMAASLLTGQPLTLTNIPSLADIDGLTNLLVQHGVTVTLRGAGTTASLGQGRAVTYAAETITSTTAPSTSVE